jgi:hypothetical protein
MAGSRFLTITDIEGLRLPDWSRAQRRAVADRVAELLIGNGVHTLPDGRRIDQLHGAGVPRPYQGQDPARLAAEIDLLALAGFGGRAGLGPEHLDTILADLTEAEEGLPPDYLDQLSELYWHQLSGQELPPAPEADRGLAAAPAPPTAAARAPARPRTARLPTRRLWPPG